MLQLCSQVVELYGGLLLGAGEFEIFRAVCTLKSCYDLCVIFDFKPNASLKWSEWIRLTAMPVVRILINLQSAF